MVSKDNFEKRTESITIGHKYGRLTILSKTTRKRGTSYYYLCKCDCGKECEVLSNRIGRSTMSCGCYKAECRGTHRMSETRLYNIWTLMHSRCVNPNNPGYLRYGGRGVTICEEWLSFENFKNWAMANGYSDRLSIDRIDVNGNYEPSNCRWATRSQQVINRRPFGIIPYDGITPDKTGYRAQLMIGGKKVYVGHATTVKRAVEMRNAYIVEHSLPHKINTWREDT